MPRFERRIAGLQVSPFGSGEPRCGCELALWFSETNGQLAGSLEYRADLFDRWTIRRLGRNFRVLLAAAVAAPREALSALPAVTAVAIDGCLIRCHFRPPPLGIHDVRARGELLRPGPGRLADASTLPGGP